MGGTAARRACPVQRLLASGGAGLPCHLSRRGRLLPSRLGGRFAFFQNDRDHLSDGDGLTLARQQPVDHAAIRRRDLGVHLVGVHFHQGFIDVDEVALGLEPPADHPFDDALAELGHDDLLGHEPSAPLNACRLARAPGTRPGGVD